MDSVRTRCSSMFLHWCLLDFLTLMDSVETMEIDVFCVWFISATRDQVMIASDRVPPIINIAIEIVGAITIVFFFLILFIVRLKKVARAKHSRHGIGHRLRPQLLWWRPQRTAFISRSSPDLRKYSFLVHSAKFKTIPKLARSGSCSALCNSQWTETNVTLVPPITARLEWLESGWQIAVFIGCFKKNLAFQYISFSKSKEKHRANGLDSCTWSTLLRVKWWRFFFRSNRAISCFVCAHDVDEVGWVESVAKQNMSSKRNDQTVYSGCRLQTVFSYSTGFGPSSNMWQIWFDLI